MLRLGLEFLPHTRDLSDRRNGRNIASNADAFHSADMDRAPTFENVHFKSMLDDVSAAAPSCVFFREVQKEAAA